MITIVEGDAHETVKQHQETIDVVFLDADKKGYIDYLQALRPPRAARRLFRRAKGRRDRCRVDYD
ncbi:MAG: hypothetical protein ACOX1P_10455 [Thermoguttaceae bacterium]|jgi:predicted O-methyltransferase YrrM